MTPNFSIVICTRNRVKALQKCILSLIEDLSIEPQIIIVDNEPDLPNTNNLINNLSSLYAKLVYVREWTVGLSHARNKGAKTATSSWILYLDDDAHVPIGFLSTLDKIIRINPGIVCFGGPYYASYEYGKPKWLREDFGTKEWPSVGDDGKIIEGYLSGGLFAIKTEVLSEAGGFPRHLGMIGSTPGYGEEDYLQDSLNELGYDRYFFSDLYIYHSILPHKFKISWHLHQSFARGRSQIKPKSTFINILNVTKSAIKIPLYSFPVSLFKLFGSKYFIQNAMIEILSPFLFNLGRLFPKKNDKLST